jgi:hypothetical protein
LWAGRKRFGRLGGRALAASVARTAVSCVPLVLWCLLSVRLADVGGSLTRQAVWLGVAIGGGAVVFIATSALLRSPERIVLWGMLPLRRSR